MALQQLPHASRVSPKAPATTKRVDDHAHGELGHAGSASALSMFEQLVNEGFLFHQDVDRFEAAVAPVAQDVQPWNLWPSHLSARAALKLVDRQERSNLALLKAHGFVERTVRTEHGTLRALVWATPDDATARAHPQTAAAHPDARQAERPPIAFHHGFLQTVSTNTDLLLGLRDHFPEVIAVEWPHHGESKLAPNVLLTTTIAEQMVAQALKQLTFGRDFSILGESLGGATAARMASLFQDRVVSAHLISPVGAVMDDDTQAALKRSFLPDTLREARRAMETFIEIPEGKMSPRLASVFRGIAALVFFERMHDRHFRAIFSEDMNAAAVTSSQLGAVLSRTQVSCGTFDRTIPKQNHTYWQDTVRAGGGEALAPAGHFHGAVMNNTSEVVANLVRYCDEVMSRRTQALEAAPAP